MGPPPRGTVAYRKYLDKKNAKARAVRLERRKGVARAFVADEIQAEQRTTDAAGRRATWHCHASGEARKDHG